MKRAMQDMHSLFNLESSMRKKAALDIQKMKVEPPSVFKCGTVLNSNGDAGYKLDCLPHDTIHLGGENFLSVSNFLERPRVHIRRYYSDQEDFIHPTKDGISLSPSVWKLLLHELRSFGTGEKTVIIDKKVCVSKQVQDGGDVYVFQRLFQRNNLRFEFVPERVVLSANHLEKLLNSAMVITKKLKRSLIKHTFFECVHKELGDLKQDPKTLDCEYGFAEMIHTLGECLTTAISEKINELLNCFGCRENHSVDWMHACKTISLKEKFSDYFESALFALNFQDIARDYVKRNMKGDLRRILYEDEFINFLNVDGLFLDIEKLYTGSEADEESISDNFFK